MWLFHIFMFSKLLSSQCVVVFFWNVIPVRKKKSTNKQEYVLCHVKLLLLSQYQVPWRCPCMCTGRRYWRKSRHHSSSEDSALPHTSRTPGPRWRLSHRPKQIHEESHTQTCPHENWQETCTQGVQHGQCERTQAVFRGSERVFGDMCMILF